MPQSLALVGAIAWHFLAPANAGCAFTQNMTAPHPVPASGDEVYPAPYAPGTTEVCMQYANSGCCSAKQRQLLDVNFLLVLSAFGEVSAGGCPACADNLKELYCAITCSPDQDTFVSGMKVIQYPVYGSMESVFYADVNVDRLYMCSMYDQCKSTAYGRELAMPCEGFFSFQGTTKGAEVGRSILNFVYSDEETVGGGQVGDMEDSSEGAASAVLSQPVEACCSYHIAGYGNSTLGNATCPPSSCGSTFSGQCPSPMHGEWAHASTAEDAGALGKPLFGTMNGFNGVLVGCLYAGFLAASAAYVFCAGRKARRHGV